MRIRVEGFRIYTVYVRPVTYGMSIPWLKELGWRRVDGFGAEGLLVIIGTLRGVGLRGVGDYISLNR